jgi:dihydrofolate reductase
MINAIFAIDEEGGMGKANALPWGNDRSIVETDLKWFKMQTIDSIVIMGRGTWDSVDMPSPLPKRINWVITSGSVEPALNGAQIWNGDPYELCLKLEDQYPNKTVWVIGGAKLLMSMAGKFDRMYVSHIYGNFNCDVKVDFAKLSEGYKEIYNDATYDLEHIIYAKLSPPNVKNT